MSKSRREKDFLAEYALVASKVRERSGGRCEARIRGVCGGQAVHTHHRRARRVRRDGKANALVNLLHLCFFCHSYIHLHVKWARENGFLLSTESDPALAQGAAVAPRPGH